MSDEKDLGLGEIHDYQFPYSAQGDLNIYACAEIPAGVEEAKPNTSTHVLAHSETGHNHVVSAQNVTVYNTPDNEFVSYMEVKETSNVVHLRSFDRHGTIRMPPGKYRITRQRERIPEGFRRAAD